MGVIERTRGMGRKPGYWLGVGLWTCFFAFALFFLFWICFHSSSMESWTSQLVTSFFIHLTKRFRSEEYFMRIKNFWSYQGKFLLVKKKWLTTWMARWHVCRKEEYWTTCWWSGKPLREVPFPSLARWTWIHCRCPRQVGTPLRQHYLRLCIIKNVTKELKKRVGTDS